MEVVNPLKCFIVQFIYLHVRIDKTLVRMNMSLVQINTSLVQITKSLIWMNTSLADEPQTCKEA